MIGRQKRLLVIRFTRNGTIYSNDMFGRKNHVTWKRHIRIDDKDRGRNRNNYSMIVVEDERGNCHKSWV